MNGIFDHKTAPGIEKKIKIKNNKNKKQEVILKVKQNIVID